MANMEENQDKRENKSENRNVNIDQNSPEILTNPIYTPSVMPCFC